MSPLWMTNKLNARLRNNAVVSHSGRAHVRGTSKLRPEPRAGGGLVQVGCAKIERGIRKSLESGVPPNLALPKAGTTV